jgi:hypothetical protein
VDGRRLPSRRAGGVVHKLVALPIDFRADFVRDATRGAAELDPLVIGRRTKPERLSAPVNLRRAPEPHVVPLFWAVADWLLEGGILLTAPDIQVAHRSMGVGLPQHDVGSDANRSLQRDRIGCIPSGGGKHPVQFLFCADEGHVDGIALTSLRRRRMPRRSGKGRVPVDSFGGRLRRRLRVHGRQAGEKKDNRHEPGGPDPT